MGLTQITTGGVDDNINIDSNTLKVDGTNNRVGIGTAAPQRALVVSDAGDEGFEFFPGSSDTGNTLNHYDRGSSSFIDITTNADKHIFGRADGEKMRIDSSGKVQIGRTSPLLSTELTVGGNNGLTVGKTNGSRIGMFGSFNQDLLIIGTYDDFPVVFRQNNTERMRIDSSGNVGIGHNAPPKQLSLADSTQPTIGFYTGSTLRAEINATSAETSFLSYANSPFTFNIGGSAETEAVRIDSSGRVGIGTTSPSDYDLGADDLVVANSGNGGVSIITGTSSVGALYFGDGTSSNQPYRGRVEYKHAEDSLNFGSAGTLHATLDSSGRLLVGSSAGQGNSLLQVEGDATSGAAEGSMSLRRGLNTAAIGGNVGAGLGIITFGANDGTVAARIGCESDAAWSSTSDCPGRLMFSTSADGASSPTERARITQKGAFKAAGNFGIVDANGPNHEFNYNDASNHVIRVDEVSTSYTQSGGGIFHINCRTAHSSGWTFGGWYSGNVSDREFNFRGDGNGYADGSWNGGGADYAEFFEWSDSNAKAEDRRGISVVLDGDKIREAVAGEEPIGVISGNPSVVGDADIDRWKGKYLRDDYGTYIQEDYEVEDDDGNTVVQQRRQLNPDYNPDTEYVSREDRPEWDCVGLMGKLRIRKGQVTGTRWIKMRDVSSSVEEWLVR